ncbi:MAG: hypothetical protein QOH25_839 [Acidobacteriota bacterium]|jgi:hypothetical protein|nr:hypothetical protein [Acidobacteriota bacterium]
MSEVLKKLGKLRGRSLGELRQRGAQFLAACEERYGVSSRARLPDDAEFFRMLEASPAEHRAISAETLLDDFRTRTSPEFFAAFADPEKSRAELNRRFGASSRDALLERARRIVEGDFDLLGLRDLSFGNPPDWHLEPVANRRAPLVHWSRINYLDAEVAGDKKITWELNRHQYFATLGRAYWHTNDERYAETFAAHLESWMNENPPKLGINWASSLEVSFRAISWLWALHFFKGSAHLTPSLYLRALKFLYLHATHLETYLSTYFSPNTHLTGEALGLYYLGTMLPEFRRAARWRERGRSILLQALNFQVRTDGVYFEQASYYHRYTADFYTHFYILSQINGQPIEAKLTEKLSALLDHLMYITRPDGLSPLFGDDDGGRLVMLDERALNDFRSTLATGAALLSRGDYKYVAEDASEETFWLLGSDGLKIFDELHAAPPIDESRAFTESGYFIMRDGWTKTSNYLLVDCGPHGALNGAHAHADSLSFELAARGRSLLVDAGTYTYTGSAEMRDSFRSSAAHNTLTIDNESSSVHAGPFHWRHVAQSTLRDWLSHARFDYFEGTHDGYARLKSPAIHTRSLLFLKGGYWVMRDRVSSEGAHACDLHFHFDTNANPSCMDEEGEAAAAAARVGWDMQSGLELLAFGGEWVAGEGWVSSAYGQRSLAPSFTFSAKTEGEQEFITFMIPRAQSLSPKTLVQERSARGGRAFEVRPPETCDIVMIGDGNLTESERCVSDFNWSWARFSSDGAQLEELLLIGGRQFHLDGQAIFDSKRRANYVVARRVGDELLIETDGDESSRVPLEDEEARSRVYSV